MAVKDKKFYWIKLKKEFIDSEAVDFLMSQKNGANYIVLYQMLIMKTINTNGRLCNEIGELIIPFDAEKIQRDCKWFDIDTVRVAMDLYSRLGLIYKSDNDVFQIVNFEEMVGSETYWAKQKRLERINSDTKEIGNCPTNVQIPLISNIYNSNIYNSNDNIKKEKNIIRKEKGIIDTIEDDKLKETLKDFIKMRKTIKKPLTDRAFELILNKLNKFSLDTEIQIKILEQSILNGWQDVWELKQTKEIKSKEVSMQDRYKNIAESLKDVKE